MKLLEKIFDLLEYVVLQNGVPVTPSMAAEALGLNPVTATRILQGLVRRGYLVQRSRKTGYVPGPMILSLGTRQNAFSAIAKAAEGPIRELSETVRRQVNIAVLHSSRRIMLCFHLPDSGLSPWKRFLFSDHWQTATGRLLIASLNPAEAAAVFKECGIPPCPEAERKKIREDGFVRFPQKDLTIIGHSVCVPGYPAAAFGFGVPKAMAKEAFCLSARTAKIISERLSNPVQAY